MLHKDSDHCKGKVFVVPEIFQMYHDTYRIVGSVSQYVSYRETSVLLQPYYL